MHTSCLIRAPGFLVLLLRYIKHAWERQVVMYTSTRVIIVALITTLYYNYSKAEITHARTTTLQTLYIRMSNEGQHSHVRWASDQTFATGNKDNECTRQWVHKTMSAQAIFCKLHNLTLDFVTHRLIILYRTNGRSFSKYKHTGFT